MPVTFSQAGHTFDVIVSNKGLRVETNGKEVFRYWPGQEYAADLPFSEHDVTPATFGAVSYGAGDVLNLSPGTYSGTFGGQDYVLMKATSGTFTLNVT